MSVGVLLITHDGLGRDLIDTAGAMLGASPLAMQALEVSQADEPDEVVETAHQRLRELDEGLGVLVLTDAYGSTPSNIAQRLAADARVVVVAGVNLPMLIRVLNYPRLSLAEMAEKAVSGGRDGIVPYHEDTGP
ncbi:MAG: PTS fructose transporter subunit IIA [Gammaproteobacteria bacterium]|nr:PTS fructose transporter subunit IIA [Gammaproteobacteria bacterium]NIR82888.1 PTS fructose transporter subunit IIA [Gammaproteobacteria bacterium]NIR90000.1 PTS fructose transporter subunit IIA [Gammaproteobacteria bacterium]NIU03480.1 PTS fructose transporter subunit IIA [Gammaproteobacteria bacterium]NIV50999.1 PTS fructose transporter subunit IIA [Gammaproteobacteria bacterium]